MGLIAWVYKDGLGDCTNGGITSGVDKVCVVNVSGPFDPSDDMPALILKAGVYGDPILVPSTNDGDPVPGWHSFGGNYVASSDSRFSRALQEMTGHNHSHYAVPVHDRTE